MKNVALSILQKEYSFYSVKIETRRQCHFVQIGSAICGILTRSQVFQIIMTVNKGDWLCFRRQFLCIRLCTYRVDLIQFSYKLRK